MAAMNSQDDAEFADLDRSITWQLGRAAAQLTSQIDTRARLREVLRSSAHDNKEADAISGD
jgi:hypothetical protein